MRIVDSGVLIALFRKGDEFHLRATELLKRHSDESILCPAGVFQEVVEFILRHDGRAAASKAAEEVLHSPELTIEAPSLGQLAAAIQIFAKTHKLTFCDSLTVAMAREKGIRQLLSFDSDFDAFKEFRRLF